MGRIAVSDVKKFDLGKQNSLLSGHYSLNEPGEEPVKGAFTLVFTKTSSGWKILREQLTNPRK